jgi:erythromycin esterase-like protein
MRISAAALLIASSLIMQAQTTQSKPTLEQALLQARTSLILKDGKFSDPGALVLDTAVQQSRFVLLGEDHLTREIPQFAAALCDTMHPDAYAVEVGPYAARFVGSLLSNPDRIPLMAARNKAYPNSMAFLDMREENDLAAHCAASSHDPHFALWGLDQEFLGSAGTLLQSMAATNPGPLSRAAIASAQAKERTAAALATSRRDFNKLFLPASTDTDIQALQSAVDADGTAATRDLLNEFTLSRKIYRLFRQSGSDSNLVRDQLLKQHFLADYLPFKQQTPSPRILFKFGDNHTGKGFDENHQLNLGDFIAEVAAGEQAQSLHLLVFGAHGMHYDSSAGYGQPLGHKPFVMSDYPDYKWLALATSNLIPADPADPGTQLTLFDLRQLRYRGIDLPRQWEDAIYSYDLLILIPQLSVASLIQ